MVNGSNVIAATLETTFGVDVRNDRIDATDDCELEAVMDWLHAAFTDERWPTMDDSERLIVAQRRIGATFVAWRRLAQAGLYADPITRRREARAARDALVSLGVDPNALPAELLGQ